MAKNFVFILTEGDHDSAFIYRILKANGMETDHKTAIKDYPSPLDKLIKNAISSVPVEELNMEVARSRFLPSYIMQKDDNVMSIYRIGGVSKEKVRVDFIRSINAFNNQDPDAFQAFSDTQMSVLFFFDADDRGIDKRIDRIKKELKLSFPGAEAEYIDSLVNKEILLIEGIKVGGFVFTKERQETGLLEDILIPLMKQGNQDIFDKAEQFLGIHEITDLFRNGITYNEDRTVKKKINGKEYSHKKSLVGTVGQLQMSGTSNTVCISKSDYLNDDKIKADTTCIAIYTFIEQTLR